MISEAHGRTLLTGGLGWPHDELVAAALGAEGHDTTTLGALDDDALERGRAALPRGQCAPVLYTTGALLRAAEQRDPRQRLTYVSAQSCGPCRYALFKEAWARALARAGHDDVQLMSVEQSVQSLLETLGADGARRVMEATVTADALAEVVHRLRPYTPQPGVLADRAARVSAAITRRIEAGEAPVDALAAERGWHRGLVDRPSAPLARAAIIGEPWSLHVEGDGQLNLPHVLADAGVEVEIPPLALWIAYRLWELRRSEDASRRTVTLASALDDWLRHRFDCAVGAAGLRDFELPDPGALAELAAPHLFPGFRGGYGAVEVGLAVRARTERRAHVVLSVKSFGCIPSAGVSDGVLPTALGVAMPYLSVEVCGDGDAARESRLMLRVASAREQAEAELGEACSARGVSRHEALQRVRPDPLAGVPAGRPRPYACSLACRTLRSQALGAVARTQNRRGNTS